MHTVDDIPEKALQLHSDGVGAVLATVIETWGSAPRRVGSQLVIAGDGRFEGSVSGGCVEGAVVLEAQDALASGEARILEYGVSDGDAFAVGLACGGTIRILLEPVGKVLPAPLLQKLVDARQRRIPVAYEVDTKSGARHLAQDGHAERFRTDRSGMEADGRTLIVIHNPPLRMVIIGAVHIAQALVPMARLAGYDPILIDPRPGFAAPERFAGERILDDWPDDAVRGLDLDARSALVLLTHDPKLDDAALSVALHKDIFYIGALGSTRTHAKRVTRLRDAGFSEAQIARIHAPIGLDIGAAGPAEIAVAIIAEVTRALRKPV